MIEDIPSTPKELIERYFATVQNKYDARKIGALESRIRDLVLTGEEIMQLELYANPGDPTASEEYKKLENSLATVQEKCQEIDTKYNELKKQHEEIKKSYEELENKSLEEQARIKKGLLTLIKNKQGPFVEEIKKILESKN